MDLSVIVPVYNTPVNVLYRCFDSINGLTGIDYEVLIIDDGSAEKTSQYIDDYINQNTYFKCIHQKNCGVSFARNRGLLEARGKYISFVDSDDVLIPTPICKFLGGGGKIGMRI